MNCKNCGHPLKQEKKGVYHYDGHGQGTTRCHHGSPYDNSPWCHCEKPEAELRPEYILKLKKIRNQKIVKGEIV